MRIAILTTNFFIKTKEFDGEDRIIFGGAERYLVELCKFFQAEGHHVEVFHPIKHEFTAMVKEKEEDDWQQATMPTYVIAKEYDGIRITCLPLKDPWDFGTSPALNYMFNEFTASFDLRVYFVTFLAFPEVRRPAISISHGIFWDISASAYRVGTKEYRDEFLRRNLYGFTAPDACVAVDTNVRGVVAALLPGSENRIHVVPNFVDTSVFRPGLRQKKGYRGADRPTVLFPRRLSSVRGVNDFLWLAAQCPDIDFIVCGNSADDHTEVNLDEFAKGQKNIKAIWRPMEQMADVYQEADFAIIPTRGAEGSSLALLESMATGLPVIASNAGGLPNLVIDNWNGYQIDMNHEKLVNAVKRMLASPDDMKKFGERNRQIAVECFDIGIWKAKWKKVLDRVIR